MPETPATPQVEVVSSIPKDQRLYAALCHFAGLPVFTILGLANVLAPLVIWLMKKETMPFVDQHGKESLNFQLTMLIAYAVVGMTFCLGVGRYLIGALVVLQIIFPLIAGIAAYDGKPYRYPLALRLI